MLLSGCGHDKLFSDNSYQHKLNAVCLSIHRYCDGKVFVGLAKGKMLVFHTESSE